MVNHQIRGRLPVLAGEPVVEIDKGFLPGRAIAAVKPLPALRAPLASKPPHALGWRQGLLRKRLQGPEESEVRVVAVEGAVRVFVTHAAPPLYMEHTWIRPLRPFSHRAPPSRPSASRPRLRGRG